WLLPSPRVLIQKIWRTGFTVHPTRRDRHLLCELMPRRREAIAYRCTNYNVSSLRKRQHLTRKICSRPDRDVRIESPRRSETRNGHASEVDRNPKLDFRDWSS